MLPQAFLTRPIAHRALHDISKGRPENSQGAVRAAVDAGYGIEIDVQLSADNEAMVFHDYDLARLTGQPGAVRQQSSQSLRETKLLHSDEGIPTLSDVLDTVAGRVPLLIETKDQDGALGADVGPLERAVAEALQAYSGPVALMSFNPYSVVEMARLLPRLPRGVTTCDYSEQDWPTVPKEVRTRLRAIPDYDRVGACFISHQWTDLAAPRVAEIASAGASVLCWTIRSAADEAQARQIAHNVTFEGYAA